MRIHLLTQLLLAALLLGTKLSFAAQDTLPKTPPEPSALHPNWWEYFEVQDQEIAHRIDTTQTHFDQMLENVSDKNRAQAKELIVRIMTSLKALAQLKQQLKPPLPSPKPIAATYRIEKVIELYRTLRKTRIDLKNATEEKQTLLRQRGAATTHLTQLKEQYQNTEERSQEKLLVGLEIIAAHSAIELTNRRLNGLNQLIDAEEETIEQLNVEVRIALSRIVSSTERLSELKEQIDQATAAMSRAKQELISQELEAALSSPGTANPLLEANDQFLNQKVMQAQIRQTHAHIHLIYLKSELTLTELTSTPPARKAVSLYRKQMFTWLDQLDNSKLHISEWTAAAQTQIQNTGQILSLSESEGASSPNLLYTQQQTIQLAYENLLNLQRLSSEVDDTVFLLTEIEHKLDLLLPEAERWFRKLIYLISNALKKTLSWLDQTLFHAWKTPITLFNLLRFLLIILCTIWISRLTLRGLNTILAQKRKGIKKAVTYRFSRLVHYTILTIGFIIAFSSLGFDFTNLVLIAGALGVGLGFGLQSIFNNFVSGIIILFESYLRIGDFIELDNNLRGEVREIRFRSLMIRTNDGIDILIPNSFVVSNLVINWTLNDPYRRMHIPFSVAYGTDKELLKRVVVAAAQEIEYTLNKPNIPPPEVRFIKFGDSSLDFELAIWVNEKASRRTRKTRSAYLFAIDNVLAKHGIVVPFPKRDIHLCKDEINLS